MDGFPEKNEYHKGKVTQVNDYGKDDSEEGKLLQENEPLFKKCQSCTKMNQTES